jgi:hypothetical protein
MSPSLRFLGLALFAWSGVRALSLGLVPGTHVAPGPAIAVEAVPSVLEAEGYGLPPFEPTMLPPIPPIEPAIGSAPTPPAPPRAAMMRPYPAPISWPRQADTEPAYPFEAVEAEGAATPPPQLAQAMPPIARPAPLHPRSTPDLSPPPFDRLQLSGWAMIRQAHAPPSLANAPTLGASQAGARLLWRFDRRIAATLRMSSPVAGARGGEVAVGARFQPVPSLPVALTAERRKAFGTAGGSNGFALFLEGGLSQMSLPAGLRLDSYLQAGAVGAKRRDWFVDGSAAVSRPLWGRFSAGAGIWGGAQPRLSRLDAGPRLSMEVRPGMRVHGDYRRKLLGNAAPGSGGVVTVAADF